MSTDPRSPLFEQPPGPPPDSTSWSGEVAVAPSSPTRRRMGRTVAAAVSILALVAGGGFFLLSRRPDPAVALTLSFAEGGTHRYALRMRMNGTVSTRSPEALHRGFVMDVSETLSWRVVSVDDEGVATLEVAIEDLSGTINGESLPVPKKDMTVRVRIAPDGRILTGGNLSFASAGSGQGFPGMDQFSALLPDRPVTPGDTWTKDFSCPIPFGQGRLRYTTRNRFERYEEIDGVRTAVISSRMTLPMDFTLNVRKLMKSLGQSPAQAGLPTGARPRIVYGGRGTFETTSWIAPEGGVLVKSTSRGNFSMNMSFVGFPEGQTPPGAAVSFGGNFTTELHRL